jgi:hypothetical protein
MTTRDDWIQEVIANVGGVLDAALATVEDLYQRFVPEEQRSQAEHLYKTYVPDIMPRHWSPTRTPEIGH